MIKVHGSIAGYLRPQRGKLEELMLSKMFASVCQVREREKASVTKRPPLGAEWRVFVVIPVNFLCVYVC